MTMTLLTLIVGFSAIAGVDTYQRVLAVNDAERVAGVLRHARGLAQGGTCQVEPCDGPKSEGVRITSREVLLFEGEVFEEEAILDSTPLSSFASAESKDILFLPRSGRSLRHESLHMTDAYGRLRIVSVSEAGVISIDPF